MITGTFGRTIHNGAMRIIHLHQNFCFMANMADKAQQHNERLGVSIHAQDALLTPLQERKVTHAESHLLSLLADPSNKERILSCCLEN